MLRIPTGGGTPQVIADDLDGPLGIQVDSQIHVATLDQVLEISIGR